MNTQICFREDDLLEALERGFIGEELESHLKSCAACSEVRLVAGALLEARSEAIAEAPVPAAGGVWWRMRMRHRREAEATARRSLLVGQAMTLGVALALVALFFGADIAETVRHAAITIRLNPTLLVTCATLALLAPIGGWVAIRQK
jgi:predicted anti-sigma-YlaC factor YlaD